MRQRLKKILLAAVLTICAEGVFAEDSQPVSDLSGMPAVETILLEPVELENIQLWVTADTTGVMKGRSFLKVKKLPVIARKGSSGWAWEDLFR